MKIGVPRAVYYYDYYPFWAGFFRSLGIEIKVSPKTNRKIMEDGLKRASDDTCLPIKVLVGHLHSFKDVDAIFLPRMVSMEERTYLCPKFLGLPESVISNSDLKIPVLSVNVNAREGKSKLKQELGKFAETLGFSARQGYEALKVAERWQEAYWQMRREGMEFEAALKMLESFSNLLVHEENQKIVSEQDCLNDKPTIALIGHPYLIYEEYANLNLLSKLKSKANVRLIENLDFENMNACLTRLRKPMFWGHGRKILGAGFAYVDHEQIDGIIYLTCFACGTDSITQDIVARSARQARKPFMTITLDEHSGEAGLITRIEAYIDMIERRKSSEGHLSAHG